MSLLRRVRARLAVPPDPFRKDPKLDALVSRLCAEVAPGARVLNLGARTTAYPGPVVNLDLEPFPGVHVCGDGGRLPFRTGAFAVVLLQGVLEHVRSAEAVMCEVERVLAPSGLVYIEVPFLQPFHASPQDYRRFTLTGLRDFLPNFQEIQSGVQIGPLSALTWMTQESLATLFARGSTRAYVIARAGIAWLTFWLKHLDRWVVPAPYVANCASAVYYLGRRRG